MDTISAPTNAAENVVTLKPFIIVPRYQNSKPFMISENKPRVMMLSGSVSMFMIGFKNILKSARHAPTTRDTHIGFTTTPLTTFVVAHTATESTIQ